jgi:hypothetical protein
MGLVAPLDTQGNGGEFAALIAGAVSFHPWDAMTPAALAAIAQRSRRRPFEATAETGCGGSTIVLSHLSRRHTAFALEGTDHTISELKGRGDLAAERVAFVAGETKQTVPAQRFPGKLDLILLDGPHAYPLPQIEFSYLFPHLHTGGWLVIDDLQIPSVYELFRYLKSSREIDFEEVVGRTAFFRRAENRGNGSNNPDGWWLQEINRRLVWRYSWRDRLRRMLRPSCEA